MSKLDIAIGGGNPAFLEDILTTVQGIDRERLKAICAAEREGRLRIERPRYKCPKCGRTMVERVDCAKYLCFECKTEITREAAEKEQHG